VEAVAHPGDVGVTKCHATNVAAVTPDFNLGRQTIGDAEP
jgi:hypothetical protein